MDIRQMRDEDLPEVIRLLDVALGPAPAGTDRRALFEWKHLQNPAGRSIALVGVDGERIIGLRVFMRWRFQAGEGEPFLAARAVDTATDPSATRQGVFSRLTMAGLEVAAEQGVRFIFNTPNTKSAPGYLKMGWSEVGQVPMFLRSRRPLRLARAVLGRDLQSGPSVPVETTSELMPAAEALGREDVASLVAHMSGPSTQISTERSMPFLRWRYGEGPIAYYALVRGEQSSSVAAIFRVRRRGERLTEVVLSELLVGDDGASIATEILRDLAGMVGADHVVTHIGPGWPSAALLSKARYRRAPKMGMLLTAKRVAPGDEPDPLEEPSWGLMLGDLELF